MPVVSVTRLRVRSWWYLPEFLWRAFAARRQRWLALNGPMRWPHGLPTMPEVNQQIGGTKPIAFDRDVAELRRTMTRFAGTPRDFEWGRHPAFGAMTGAEWLRWDTFTAIITSASSARDQEQDGGSRGTPRREGGRPEPQRARHGLPIEAAGKPDSVLALGISDVHSTLRCGVPTLFHAASESDLCG